MCTISTRCILAITVYQSFVLTVSADEWLYAYYPEKEEEAETEHRNEMQELSQRMSKYPVLTVQEISSIWPSVTPEVLGRSVKVRKRALQHPDREPSTLEDAFKRIRMRLESRDATVLSLYELASQAMMMHASTSSFWSEIVGKVPLKIQANLLRYVKP